MATIPTSNEIVNHLEGYGIVLNNVISNEWIVDERDNDVIPFVESVIGASVSSEETFTEYLNGNGTDILFISRRNANNITSIELVSGADIDSTISLSSIQLISEQGIIKSIGNLEEYMTVRKFPKGRRNIKVVYTAGGTLANDLAMAIKKLTCISILDNLEGRTGGGSLNVQGFGRNYGNMGKYHNIRTRLSDQAMAILNRYKTSMVAS